MSFKAFRIHQQDKGVSVGFEQIEVDDLTPGGVLVQVTYSGKIGRASCRERV